MSITKVHLDFPPEGWVHLSDFDDARLLFLNAGLAFPAIPEELSSKLKMRGKWIFSTREIEVTPYDLQHYVRESEEPHLEDYVVLSHSGHGINSYALQYYVVRGALKMFLHLGWGGVYMDVVRATTHVRECFLLADEIVQGARATDSFSAPDRLTVVASDFYGSYWTPPGEANRKQLADFERPVESLQSVIHWISKSRKGKQ